MNPSFKTMISSEKKAKLKWRCRRGMLELDLILERFLTYHLDELTDKQLNTFENLLNSTDPDLYTWLMGYASPRDEELAEIVTFIRLHDNL